MPAKWICVGCMDFQIATGICEVLDKKGTDLTFCPKTMGADLRRQIELMEQLDDIEYEKLRDRDVRTF